MGAICCHRNQSSDPIWSKTSCSLKLPRPNDVSDDPLVVEIFTHWSVIKHRPRKQDIEPGNYNMQHLEKMADLYGEI